MKPDKHYDSTIDELLANPFDDQVQSSPYSQDLHDAEMLSKKQYTNEKIIDRLPEHRQAQARDLAQQIDENNMAAILAYGANAQKKLSEFSREVIHNIDIKDTDKIGETLARLMHELQAAKPRDLMEERNPLKRIFSRAKASVLETQIRYQKIGNEIDKITIKLERERNDLLNDNQILESFYERNKDYFEALNIYIAAGEVKMQELQTEIIPGAIADAKESGNQMDVQKVNDLNQFLDRLDKRVHDLRLTRQMTLQQAPQIRLIQNTNQALAEKIQVSIHTAIPLWENQIGIALALLRQKNASLSQRLVTDTTNQLLLENSEMLKGSSLEIARETERGVIDLETLQKSQQNLMDTITETLEIQEAGRQQRRLAESELMDMENALRDTLFEISENQKRDLLKEDRPS